MILQIIIYVDKIHWRHVLSCWHNTYQEGYDTEQWTFYISSDYAYAMLWQLYMPHCFCSSLIINIFCSVFQVGQNSITDAPKSDNTSKIYFK